MNDETNAKHRTLLHHDAKNAMRLRWGQSDAKYMQLFVILSIDRFVNRYAVIYELVKLDACP